MYTFSVAGPQGRYFQVRPPVVAFAGSRRGSLSESVTLPLAHAFHALDLSLLTGCASGIDACFRRVMVKQPFEEHSMVACAFESRARRFDAEGLFGIPVVPVGLPPAAALHRFARMISEQYGRQVELQIADDLFPVRNTAVEDILKSIENPEPVHRCVPGMALQLIFWCVAPEVKLSAVTGRKDYTNKATA